MENKLKKGKGRPRSQVRGFCKNCNKRDKGGLDQVERLEVVRNNKVLDIFLKVEPTLFINKLDVGCETKRGVKDQDSM